LINQIEPQIKNLLNQTESSLIKLQKRESQLRSLISRKKSHPFKKAVDIDEDEGLEHEEDENDRINQQQKQQQQQNLLKQLQKQKQTLLNQLDSLDHQLLSHQT